MEISNVRYNMSSEEPSQNFEQHPLQTWGAISDLDQEGYMYSAVLGKGIWKKYIR